MKVVAQWNITKITRWVLPSKRNKVIVFIEEHFIQFFILSNYKAINVLSGELYQGDPDLYWSFTFYSFNKVANL